MKRHAFTIIELLIVMAMIALMMAILIPSIDAVREQVRRTKCSTHLGGFGKVFAAYAAETGRDRYPDAGLYTSGATTTINTTGSLWILVIRGLVQTENFICPTDEVDARAEPYLGDPKASSPFPKSRGRATLSYSYQVPHPSGASSRNPGADHENPVVFAIMADRSPFDDVKTATAPGKLLSSVTLADGTTKPWSTLATSGAGGTNPSGDTIRDWAVRTYKYKIGSATVTAPDAVARKQFNSNNHRGEGQNVLFRDGHVEWKTTPICGVADDNIYTRSTVDKSAKSSAESASPNLNGRTVGDTMDNVKVPFDTDDSFLRTYPNF